MCSTLITSYFVSLSFGVLLSLFSLCLLFTVVSLFFVASILFVILYVLYRLHFLFMMWYVLFFFFFKHKTAYEMRISDWSSDVCSSDLYSTRPLRLDIIQAVITALHSSCLPCSRTLLITFPRPFNGGDFVLYASAIASHWHGEVRLFEFAVHDLVALSDDHRNLIFMSFEPINVMIGH